MFVVLDAGRCWRNSRTSRWGHERSRDPRSDPNVRSRENPDEARLRGLDPRRHPGTDPTRTTG